ncbi:uroporphyrinogen-III synthase [Gillisia limnaea]|uniref:Uroporphyrinogen III synthase HEM4 n=1 Tax=Gillisia limnaea (strain DSM 15749 / LMG 21470 / R-8282) TaxID=865937 RepID=H2BT10_GILLR|nr:uroporphyrinogen-III synthase [Gillisia limnaea]EHQ02568.1 Uroporphyrinogen III synthase HEM4 [Gillisia limnaea DSM 15749]
MPTVLSTKILEPHQKQLLLNAGMSLVEYNAIKIEFKDFDPGKKFIKNAIITSKNTAKAILRKNLIIENCFCVGEKTAAFLKEKKYNITEIADYGTALATIITKNYSDENFSFFCGDKRREELPSILKENTINVEEIQVYKTTLNPKKFQQEFDGVLFFSPSGVKSFFSKNKIKNSTAFCIGTTTASEARKFTENIVIATKPSIENVIVQVVKKIPTP